MAEPLHQRWMVCRIGPHRVAARLSEVELIQPLPTVRRPPLAPPALRGLVVFRDALLPVFDGGRWLEAPCAHTLLWVLRAQDDLFGITVDEGDRVVSLHPVEGPTWAALHRTTSGFGAQGAALLEGALVWLLDVRAVRQHLT